MKKTITILILLVFLFLGFEFGINFFKQGHETSYKIYVDDIIFNIVETYHGNEDDYYLINIENDKEKFFYTVKNNYNKQKQIIDKIEYFKDENNICIYPVLTNGKGLYLECTHDNKFYTASSYFDKDFVLKIGSILKEKGYDLYKNIDTEKNDKYGNSTIYTNNLIESDTVILWTYKGINTINFKRNNAINLLSFDKYENNHGYLVDGYYIFPNYLSSKVLEFSSVNVINLNKMEKQVIDIGYVLSSDTYINGVVDDKLYYTDPSNLLQIEINPKNKNARLVGSRDIGGTLYNGKWQNVNIYDFSQNKILFQKEVLDINFSYLQIIETYSSYYFYNSKGEVYQLSKNNLTSPILLFKQEGLNNFNVIDDTIYYVKDNTLYYYRHEDGIVPIVVNNDLRYNSKNRISIYRNV